MKRNVWLDSKGRINLGKLAAGVDAFAIETNTDGSITLTPMILITLAPSRNRPRPPHSAE